jgi:hypothetical protein
MAAGWTAGVRVPVKESPQRPDWVWDPHSLLSNVHQRISSEVKRQGRESYHSPPSSADVNNGEAIPSLPVRHHGVVLN